MTKFNTLNQLTSKKSNKFVITVNIRELILITNSESAQASLIISKFGSHNI